MSLWSRPLGPYSSSGKMSLEDFEEGVERLSSKSVTGVDVCLDLDFGLLMVESPLKLVTI